MNCQYAHCQSSLGGERNAASQAEMSKGEAGLLSKVMAAFARPTRLVNSQKVGPDTQVDDKLFQEEEERQLHLVYQQVASQVMQL